MLFLIFQIGADRYAIDAKRIIEVLPLLKLKAVPHAVPGVAGICNFRGALLPVLDLNAMAAGQPARRRLSTRIALVQLSSAGQERRVGIILENATETIRCEAADFSASPVKANAPYLGEIISDSRGIVQLVQLEKLISP